ncbi:adenine phosphoribosyltransferase [uncultured Gulosibacter sp.]|uniref:adenine phosphoribosyltransferase n=1 Tax=uncultured Gulosibacter sp. TaxID=1339167 RepID=UPI0028895C5F|nr:adenine phosphoribosyltransferase [uncultured Gulosibacter sp.]
MLSSELERAKSLIVSIPDYPAPGVIFRDIMPLLADAEALRAVTAEMLRPFTGQFDVVAGVEARGFLFAGAAAAYSGVGLAPIRKAGKLPRPAASVEYALEYGRAVIEMHDDLPRGTRVLLLDDVLATGGTLLAAQQLIREIGCEVVGTSVLVELEELGGGQTLSRGGAAVHRVFSY